VTARDDTADVPDDEPLVELGAMGLRRAGGQVTEEFLVDLQGTRAAQVYREMSDNDPVVGGILFAIEMIPRQIDWMVEPGGVSAQDAELADFVFGCMHDMATPWVEFIAEVLSMMRFGFAPHEVVYKHRGGPDPGTTVGVTDGIERPLPPSKFNDGKLGWAKLPIRAQESVFSWVWDDSADGNGELIAMTQQPPPDYIERTIPLSKLLLFRTTTHKGNPEGRSVLRNAYRPWYYKRSIEEIEAIGIERDLAGLPVAKIPRRLFSANATTEERAALAQWTKTVRDVRRDSLEGIVIPVEYDKDGHPLYEFELLTTGGTRQIDTNAVIGRKNVEIATTVLADFILLGHEKVGSFALASSKTKLFSVALGGWLDMVVAVLNEQAIPRLLAVNGLTVENPPRIAYGDLESVDLADLAVYLKTLSETGFPLYPNDPLMEHLLNVAGLPQPPDGFEDREMPDADGDGLDDSLVAEALKQLDFDIPNPLEDPSD